MSGSLELSLTKSEKTKIKTETNGIQLTLPLCFKVKDVPKPIPVCTSYKKLCPQWKPHHTWRKHLLLWFQYSTRSKTVVLWQNTQYFRNVKVSMSEINANNGYNVSAKQWCDYCVLNTAARLNHSHLRPSGNPVWVQGHPYSCLDDSTPYDEEEHTPHHNDSMYWRQPVILTISVFACNKLERFVQ